MNNMEEILSRKLKQGTHQMINEEFKNVSKRLIFASSQIERFSLKDYFTTHRLSLSFSFAVALLTIGLFQGINYFRNSDALTLSRNAQATKSEDLNLDIKLREIQYFSDSKDEVAMLLKEIKDFDSRQ